MQVSLARRSLSLAERARVGWVCARYDFWLDLNSVRRKHRKELRAELKSNLVDASGRIGVSEAVGNLGSLRHLAAETVRDGQLRSPWLAGWVAGWTVLALAVAAFFSLGLYYTEGVLDSGITESVESSLFPFFGSNIVVDQSAGGIQWEFATGPMPLVWAFLTWLLVAKPWRSLNRGDQYSGQSN